MASVHAARVSEEEFLALPESTQPTELLDGEVIVSPSPSYWHQEILRRLVLALGTWAEASGEVTIGQAPLDVRFGPGRILQPDAFVLLRPVSPAHQGPIDDIPELCIEVLSGDRVYDRVTKRLIYAASGVEELWLVEPAGIIERCVGPNLSASEDVSDTLTTPLLDGFSLDLPALFERAGRA